MTHTLATIRFKSAYLLCHVNTINAHLMCIQFDSLQMHIEIGLQWALCERAFTYCASVVVAKMFQREGSAAKNYKQYSLEAAHWGSRCSAISNNKYNFSSCNFHGQAYLLHQIWYNTSISINVIFINNKDFGAWTLSSLNSSLAINVHVSYYKHYKLTLAWSSNILALTNFIHGGKIALSYGYIVYK